MDKVSMISVLYLALFLLAAVVLWRMHTADDWFDLRDIISERHASGKVVSTSKSLLVAAFVMSSYWIHLNYTETALALFLGAWVLNGGIVAWRKTKIEAAPK